MPASERHIIIPYRKTKGGMVPGEMRPASNPESARRIATAMAQRFAGVAAYTVQVDTETGDMTDPALIIKHGTVPELVAEY